ncbi:MAG: hypothetical protein ACREJC_17075 [Tepidisphaeraceae bacterium]
MPLAACSLPLRPLPTRKPFLLRIDPAVLNAVQRWANDELRSLNGQIEFILRRALEMSNRAKSEPAQKKPADEEESAQ